MTCPHCDEPVTPRERFVAVNDGRDRFHRECFIRMLAGSAGHQMGECRCFGGTRRDPPGLTLRQAAVLAYDTFKILQGVPAADVEVDRILRARKAGA